MDFMTHPSFCGRRLYPRQQTLYRLIFLETDHMTTFDMEVIEEWRQGFLRRRDIFGVQPDIWERVDYLKKHGYRRFPHIQLVLGRRGSKGLIGGGLGCEQLAYFYSLDDWQAYYDTDRDQNGVLSVVATNQSQAQRFQFADIRRTVERCKYLQPHIATSKDHFFSIRTPADLRHIAELKAANVNIEHEIASLTAIALSSSSSAGRGGVGFCLDPETPVLTADLRWVPIRQVLPGDEVVSVEETPEPGRQRKVRKATVLARRFTRKRAYRLTFDDGRDVVCSADHRWLCQTNGRARIAKWRITRGSDDLRSIQPGAKVFDLGEPWETDTSREAGYLAGVYDGEGSVSNRTTAARFKGTEVFVSQLPGVVLDTTLRFLKEKGFVPMPCNSNVYLEAAPSKVQQWALRGTSQVLRFLGQIRPERLVAKAHLAYDGGALRGVPTRTVVFVEELPEQLLVDVQTSSGTFIANGLISHNCNFYDEMAHMVLGTGSVKSGEEIYTAWQPSLDQFAKDGLTFVPSSPFTKIGVFYKLYQDGRVLMPNYKGEMVEETEHSLRLDAEEEIEDLTADPEMLILQLPSWGLYQDWERGKELIGKVIRRPITYTPEGDLPENVRMKRLEIKNPQKFRVERRGQFAEVEGAYLDPISIEAMFREPGWRPPLCAQDRGYLTHAYRIHADPSRTNANFGFAIGHTEIAPCDRCGAIPDHAERYHQCKACHARREPTPGMHWPHVMIDLLHVWKPGEFEPDEEGRRQINYIQVMDDICSFLNRFPSTTRITFDQYDSALGIAQLRKKYSPRITVGEMLFTEKENQRRMERFKSALNLGWLHCYKDNFYVEDGGSLLEAEMKFLAERNGKVVKQDIGPVTTKDLFDAVAVVATELLKDTLDRYHGSDLAHPAFGSSDAAGLKSGRELVRTGSINRLADQMTARVGATENPGRQTIDGNRAGRVRYEPTRAQSIRARMPRSGGRGRWR